MELDAPNRKLFVAHAHHLEFGSRLGGDFQFGRHRVAFDQQRMIARGSERIRHALEEVLPIVINLRGLAVHEPFCAHDFTAEHVTHALVTETHAERWNRRAERFDNVVRQSRFLW